MSDDGRGWDGFLQKFWLERIVAYSGQVAQVVFRKPTGLLKNA